MIGRLKVAIVVMVAAIGICSGALGLRQLNSRWERPLPAPERNADAPELLIPRPAKLAAGIYLLGEAIPSAVYVVETADGLVLIDSGFDPDAVVVTRQMTKLGLDPARVRAILLTHSHADHSFGAMYFRRSFGARIYAGKGDASALRAGQPAEAIFSNFPHSPSRKIHRTLVDVELSGDEVIELGGVRFRTLATPGHTPGSTCYLLERDQLRALFTGDVLLSLTDDFGPARALGVQSTLGTYTTYLAPRFGGSARDFLASLLKLREMPAPDLVLPGHPRHDRIPQSCHLAPERWRAILDLGIREMQEVLGKYEEDGANFLDGTPKQLIPGLHYLGDYQGFAVYCLVTPAGLFLFDAPGGPGLIEFLESRLSKAGVRTVHPTAVLLTSCGSETTAGLKALVARTGCQVIVSRAGLQQMKYLCPPGAVVRSEEALDSAGWFPAQPVPLQGRGLGPIAYAINWRNKTVLISGQIPTKMNPLTMPGLMRSLSAPGGDRQQYLESLRLLGQLRPDLWLPSVPLVGQNANLYGEEWAESLNENAMALMMSWSPSGPPAAPDGPEASKPAADDDAPGPAWPRSTTTIR